MADLHGFDANKVEPRAAMEAIPAGKYLAMVTSSQMKPNKANTGQFLELVFTILEGEYKNRQLWTRLNLSNPNEVAMKIAQADLSALCRAVGVMTPNDSAELHNKPMSIKVAVRPAKGEYSESNEIKSYSARQTGPAVQSQPEQLAPVADGASPWGG